jgi:hypothetical protein
MKARSRPPSQRFSGGRFPCFSPEIGHGGMIQKRLAFNVMCQDLKHSHA